VGYSFFDETDIIQSGQPGEPGEPFQVRSTRMQVAMNTRAGGLRATGYRKSIGTGKVVLVPDPTFLEERTVGLCFKRGHTCINPSP
jgi:hypothetical protein